MDKPTVEQVESIKLEGQIWFSKEDSAICNDICNAYLEQMEEVERLKASIIAMMEGEQP